MTMFFRELADKAALDGEVSIAEALGLRASAWADGRLDEVEIGALFDLNDHLKLRSLEWVDFFVEAVTDYLIENGNPRGYVREDDALAVIERIDADGQVDSMAELLLLERLFNKAIVVPDVLKAYALAQIERAALTGEGPTRNGQTINANGINAEECRLLRSFVFAPGGDRPAAVSKAEAELLFRIKAASVKKDNAPEWKQLFVQGVGNYLQGFSFAEPLSAERASELEAFMNNTAGSIGRFFARMSETNPVAALDAARAEMNHENEYSEFDEQVAAESKVSVEEQAFLDEMINADGEIDELEKALLEFIAQV